MKRVLVLLLTAMLVGGSLVSCGSTGTAHLDGIVYGDSLVFEAAKSIQLATRGKNTIAVEAKGATALCDWLNKISVDLRLHHPKVIGLGFIGNDATPCMTNNSGTVRQKYQNAAKFVLAMAAQHHVRVVFLREPVAREPYGDPGWVDMYGAATVDVGVSVAPGDRYAPTMPCALWETAADGCRDGQIPVRSRDGIHLNVPGYPDPPAAYQGGILRYGTEISAVIEKALSRTATRE